MAGVATSVAHRLTPEDQAEKVDNADVDGDLSVEESEKNYHGQAAVWVFIEYLHTETASEYPWDKRGEFFVLVNGSRFPSKGNIHMSKDEQWTSPRPRSIYSHFMKASKAKCELTIEVRESDVIRDDRLMKFNLNQPFLPGTYRKIINLSNSPIILSLIVKLEKDVFTTGRKLKFERPMEAGEKLKKLQSKANLQRSRQGLMTSSDSLQGDPDKGQTQK